MSPSVPSTFSPFRLEMNAIALYLAAFTAVVLALRGIWFQKASKIPLPPGPRGLPLLGNLFDMPRQSAWKTFTAWSVAYGDVVRLRVLGRSIILLNSAEATTDLLENRFGIYSDRPDFPLMNLVGHNKWNFGFMPYGKQSRALRRLFGSKYSSSAAQPLFYDSHRASMGRFLQNVLRNPEGFSEYLKLRSGQLIIDVTYGIVIESAEDPLLKTTEAVMDVASVALSPPMWLMNPSAIMQFIPKWLGGSAVSLRLQRWRQDVEDLRNGAFYTCKERLSKGLAKPSYTASLLQELAPADGSLEESMIRDTAAVAYGGAFETTIISGEVFLLAIALHPEVQARAQEEIDRVVGTHRLPDFADRDRLPYVTAIMKEILRWHPPAPTGIPHLLKEDDVYRGYHIPKGSIVMGNVWGIAHDPTLYPDPLAFKPERYLAEDGTFDCSTNDPSRYVFGFGRRVCPGKFFAEDLAWLTVAQFLAVMTVTIPAGCAPPKVEFVSGAISRPVPFKCEIRPRSGTAAQLIECCVRE
ncbi:O-methylsterigmatocystin oxidoreductase [Trametes pubescens]|uniref:O-methylsterigmatocystin oxidoreductase n=1 Tax=Trametes pubescens TaxID=154538 RepID=A0A1M2VC92_TRAPU|nr:O-methylsterigmatocystin oxidoreductase [Trametes pubescens]